MLEAGEHSTAELADQFGVGRSTVYRAEQRHLAAAPGMTTGAVPQPAPLRDGHRRLIEPPRLAP